MKARLVAILEHLDDKCIVYVIVQIERVGVERLYVDVEEALCLSELGFCLLFLFVNTMLRR